MYCIFEFLWGIFEGRHWQDTAILAHSEKNAKMPLFNPYMKFDLFFRSSAFILTDKKVH